MLPRGQLKPISRTVPEMVQVLDRQRMDWRFKMISASTAAAAPAALADAAAPAAAPLTAAAVLAHLTTPGGLAELGGPLQAQLTAADRPSLRQKGDRRSRNRLWAGLKRRTWFFCIDHNTDDVRCLQSHVGGQRAAHWPYGVRVEAFLRHPLSSALAQQWRLHRKIHMMPGAHKR